MNQQELKSRIAELTALVAKELPKATTHEEVKFAAFTTIGLQVFGELLVDIKRIADAADLTIMTELRIDWSDLSPEKRAVLEKLMADIRQYSPTTKA